MGRFLVNEVIEHEGTSYRVIAICTGEGHARRLTRKTSGSIFKNIQGQWLVLKEVPPVPDYFYQ